MGKLGPLFGGVVLLLALYIASNNSLRSSFSHLGKDLLNSGGKTSSVLREPGGFYNLQATNLVGELVNFSRYRGQVAVVINVASKWGKTDSSYKALNSIYSEHKDEGLKILAFPSREFLWQEFDDPEQTRSFVEEKGVEFDMFQTVQVNGERRHEVYNYLMKCTSAEDVNWNFSTAFVIGRDGSVRARIDKPHNDNWAILKAEIVSCLAESTP